MNLSPAFIVQNHVGRPVVSKVDSRRAESSTPFRISPIRKDSLLAPFNFLRDLEKTVLWRGWKRLFIKPSVLSRPLVSIFSGVGGPGFPGYRSGPTPIRPIFPPVFLATYNNTSIMHYVQVVSCFYEPVEVQVCPASAGVFRTVHPPNPCTYSPK